MCCEVKKNEYFNEENYKKKETKILYKATLGKTKLTNQ